MIRFERRGLNVQNRRRLALIACTKNGAPGEIRTRTALVLSEMPPANWATGAWCSLQALPLPPPPCQSGALPNEREHDPEKLQTFRTRSCSKTMTLERHAIQFETIALQQVAVVDRLRHHGGRRARTAAAASQIAIWRPISTTCSPGRLKKSVTWAALRSMAANSASCQCGSAAPRVRCTMCS